LVCLLGANMEDDSERLGHLAKVKSQILVEISKAVIGQSEVLEQTLITLFAGGHALLKGVPGIAKTLIVQSLAQVLGLNFNRIQFTPDLMPSDITGSEVLEENKGTGKRSMRFIKGPLFSNLVLADEINRTPPKTQAAMLQAMQEKQVSVSGNNLDLPAPFIVLATENPIEQEGTYPLPEAQLDRFLFLINVDYPNRKEEHSIVTRTTGEAAGDLQPLLSAEEIISFQKLVRKIPITVSMVEKAVDWTRKSRPEDPEASKFIRENLRWGAGPRASQSIILAAKARAALSGRATPNEEDLLRVAYPVLRHRLILSFSAEAEGVTADSIVDYLVGK